MRTSDCPLCGSDQKNTPIRAHQRLYFSCTACALVFLAPEHRLSAAEELAHYQTHRNSPLDVGYRRFLARLADPLKARVTQGAIGLDYGSGPGPTLSLMLQEHGLEMHIYDPFFAADERALAQKYDFITCTEVAEHFFDPAKEFELFSRLLKAHGLLGLMTDLVPEDRPFETWHYPRDPTHVCFYSPFTLSWIARRYGWLLEQPARNVALFRSSAKEIE